MHNNAASSIEICITITGLRKFTKTITGSGGTVLKKITVSFYERDDNDHEAIAVKTCSTELSLPFGIFNHNFDLFTFAMNSAIGFEDLNIVWLVHGIVLLYNTVIDNVRNKRIMTKTLYWQHLVMRNLVVFIWM